MRGPLTGGVPLKIPMSTLAVRAQRLSTSGRRSRTSSGPRAPRGRLHESRGRGGEGGGKGPGLPGSLATWLPSYLATWLPSYPATWLPSYLAT